MIFAVLWIQLFTSMGIRIRIQGTLTSLKAEFVHEKDTIHDYIIPAQFDFVQCGTPFLLPGKDVVWHDLLHGHAHSCRDK
jgi:hypothetical protein